MARQPFYGRGPGPAIARMDMNAATAPGRAYGQMYANLGKQAGDTIQQYQLNKQKRDESEAAFQGDIGRVMQDNPEQLTSMQSDPVIGPTLKRIQKGNGTQKDFDKYNAYRAADKEALIEKMKLDTAQTQKSMLEVQAALEKKLSNPKVKKAIAEANTAEGVSMYSKSVASADYAKKIADAGLTRAQTVYYDAKSKAEKNSETYKPGQRVDIEGQSGNKVSFVWTGNSLQPLNDTISKKVIEEAMIEGLDQASLMAYLDSNYKYDEDTESYDFKGKSNAIGYGGGEKNPMMEQAITLLGLRGQIKPSEDDRPAQKEVKSSMPKKEPTITTQEEFDALPSGAIFIENGVEYKKP